MLEKIKEIYDKINCNSVYNSLTIRNNKISNCCCTSPYKIIENNLIIKKNYEYFCSKCIFKKEHNKFNCDKIKILDLMLFDECNADCLICDSDKKSKEITNYEILKKYDLKHLENISLLGGELFLKPEETIKCLNFLKELNVNLKILKIYTNGTIYNERLLNKFKELGINKIIFSIDDYKDNNLKTRKNCNYDLIKKNIFKIKKNTILNYIFLLLFLI